MTYHKGTETVVSVIIVNYKVPEYLRESLRSLRQAQMYDLCEIIIVDNASNDNSEEIVTSEFPEVHWIQLKNNIGFGKACNVGAEHARGEFILLLNPDTMVSSTTLTQSVEFMREHPEVGIVGPKILNLDGSLQSSCRRSFPTPAIALYHFLGLSKIFPRSKRFGRYNMTYLDPDQSSEVDAISGSFMFMRRELYKQVDGFDERFFMYGEDLDLCWKVHDKGKKVWYNPAMSIIHLKGKSSAKSQLRSRIAFYEAMVIFSKKHRGTHGSFFPGWLILIGIVAQAFMNIGATLLRSSSALFLDLLLINAILWTSITLRFRLAGMESPYFHLSKYHLLLHIALSVSFIAMYIYNGIYSKRSYTVKKTVSSGILASVLFYAFVYFIPNLAFSRIAFGISAAVVTVALVVWREILPLMVKGVKKITFVPERTVVIGDNEVASTLIKNLEASNTAEVIGVVWSGYGKRPGHFDGYPVIGYLDTIGTIIEKVNPDIIIIATNKPWYSQIIEALAVNKVKHLSVKWVPHEIFEVDKRELPDTIPLKNFSV